MKYEDLLEKISKYMNEEEQETVNKYYECAKDIYDGMKRLTGEDYICHPIRVAGVLADLKIDCLAIGCALIHEAITLEKMSYEEVSEKFGEDTADILNQVTKLSHLKRTFANTKNDEDKYRRIVVGLSANPLSLFIKLADRLDNLRSVDVHDKEHMLELIDETEKIYIPIAHRLGIKTMKSEMEDLCLRNKDPEMYNSVLNKINADNEELTNALLKMKSELKAMLDEHGINYEIAYRVKSVRGIYNKLKIGKKWEQIFDLLGLRILTNTVEECYLAIGLVHSKYRPIPKRFKDYIANPKANNYQSLHTTIFGVDGRIFEIQIRTHKMHEIAEHGVASHWSYKEKTDGSKVSEFDSTLASFRTLIEVNDKENNKEFFKNLSQNLTKEEIYIFTPKGDIIELPLDSTPIDFAYKIHSEVGNTTTGALANGKMVSLDYKLQDGDIVELITQKGKSPSKSWLKFVKTDNAKSRIRSYFYKKEREKSIETGEYLLINEIKKRHLNEKELLNEELVINTFKEFDSLNDLFISVSTLRYTPTIIVNRLTDVLTPKKDDVVEKLLANENIIKNTEKGKILIAGSGDILTNLATCCNPVLGDEIIGYITKGNGVSIHRKSCKNVNMEDERLIEAQWNENLLEKFIANITIYINSSNDNLINILSLATKDEINIISINNKGVIKDESVYELICKVKNKEILDKFMTSLESLEFISKVSR